MDPFAPKLCENGEYRVTRTELRRHMYAVFRFIDRTDEVIFITYKGKEDLVLMSVKRYSELTGVDIAARIREGKELPTHDEILASACRQAFTHVAELITPDETRSLCQKEREYDELAAKGELSEEERVFRESRAGKQWRIALNAMQEELDEHKKQQ